MIFLILIIFLILFFLVRYLFQSIHQRDSKALAGTGEKMKQDHPLYNQTEAFKNREHEIWKIKNSRLKAFYYPQSNDQKKTIILVHGFGVDHNSLNIFGQLFYRLGFNVLMPDNRAAGISKGKYVGFGLLEKKDLLEWINELNRKKSNQNIVLFGASMGAATILQTAGESLPTNVSALIEDSSYTQADEIIMYHAKKKVGGLRHILIPLISLYSKIRLGFFYHAASPQLALKKAYLPILFIVGGKDTTVPSYMGKKLYDSYQGKKMYYKNPEGTHIRSYNQNPEEYEMKISEFLDKYFKVG